MICAEDLQSPIELKYEIKFVFCQILRYFRFALYQEFERELFEVEELLENEQRASKEQLRKHSMLVQV